MTWIPLQVAWRSVTRAADAPSLQEHLLRVALRDGDIRSSADFYEIEVEGIANPEERRGFQLDASFWRYAVIEWESGSAIRPRTGGAIDDATGFLANLSEAKAFGIRLVEEDLLARWHIPDYHSSVEHPPKFPQPKRKGRGGRRGDFDWERCLIEAARWMHHEGVPAKQADLVRYILAWFGDDAPSESQVKEHLNPLFLAFRSGRQQA